MEAVGYYVDVVRQGRAGHKVGYLLGPFGSEAAAREWVAWCMREAPEIDPRAAFDAFGTCKVNGAPLPIGALNERAGL